jgi:D-serine deaminase-like pyridoxal phosphate-dependent protein
VTSSGNAPLLGCTKDDLDTPALCVDLDVMDDNIRLEVVPGYADLTIFLHDQFYGFRDGQLVEILPIAGSDASR